MRLTAAMPRGVRILLGVIVALIALQTVRYATPWLDVIQPVRNVLYSITLFATASMCLIRAHRVREERVVWILTALAIIGWNLGNIYHEGTLLDLGWLIGPLLTGIAAWQPIARSRATGDELPSIVAPTVLALASLGLLVYDHFARTNVLAVSLAAAAIVAIMVRLGLTHRNSRTNIVTTRHQARTDALTGLWNRLALNRELDRVLDEGVPHTLLLFDLDGFKNYNDSYGHPAGDALLARLGASLVAAIPASASAFRIGGDEFCVLAPGDDDAALIEVARAALSEDGEGFTIGASCGFALLPSDAATAGDALRVADRRLYAEKNSGRISARLQSAGVLRRALDECDAELGEHVEDVALLAARVARHLGLDEDEVERVTLAAELHDVGKIAVPASILHKPGPLGAQIVFVCDAFAAMTTARSYKPAMPVAHALAELRSGAGSQFAPRVVEAFEAVYTADAVTVPH